MSYLTDRERETADEVFAQYDLTAPELATARNALHAAMEVRAAVKRGSPLVNFQGPDAYHAAHTVAARIERER